MENKDFTKEFFQNAWGEDGYYENFNYGVGIDAVCNAGLFPFASVEKNALEIGCGGGVFTQRMLGKFKNVTGIDVIRKPERFKDFPDFKYIELQNQSFGCDGVPDSSIDFCFCYNVFCHISNKGLSEYLKSIHRVLKPGADFVFMLSSFENAKKHFPEEADKFQLGDMLPIGHFYQSEETLKIISKDAHWDIVSENLLPYHRDIIVHLKKKTIMYTQNQEEKFITEHFGDFTGTLLSIGENDGKTLSNSLRLIELGWKAVLVEPSPTAFDKMKLLHKDRNEVICIQAAIADKEGEFPFYESGTHLNKGDTALLSSLNPEELQKWINAGNDFQKIGVNCITYASLLNKIKPIECFDFISLDAEGLDLTILKQIDLSNTKLLCIEWNLDRAVRTEVLEYCGRFWDPIIIYESPENLLITHNI
jgi:FkbM family methyltransferase